MHPLRLQLPITQETTPMKYSKMLRNLITLSILVLLLSAVSTTFAQQTPHDPLPKGKPSSTRTFGQVKTVYLPSGDSSRAGPTNGGKGAFLQVNVYPLDNEWIVAISETHINSGSHVWDLGALGDVYQNNSIKDVGYAAYVYGVSAPATARDSSAAYRTACYNNLNYSGTTYNAEAKTSHYWRKLTNGQIYNDNYGTNFWFSCY